MAELRVKSTGTLKLFENDNTSSVTIASPASLGGDRTVTLPDADVTLASGTMSTFDPDGAVTINDSGADIDFRVESNNKQYMLFVDGGTDRVGINKSVPTSTMEIEKTLSDDTQTTPETVLTLSTIAGATGGTNMEIGNGTGLLFKIADDETNPSVGAMIAGERAAGDDSDSSTRLSFYVSQNDETLDTAMQIDSSGHTYMPDASDAGRIDLMSGYTNPQIILRGPTTSNTNKIVFYNGNGAVGSITTNGSATAFNTSSDYRLKENETSITDGIDRIKQLKPYRFNFKTDATKTVDGFFAHEVSGIVPEAISGDKDAMHPEVLYTAKDELPEGKNIGDVKEATKINAQGIDQAKLVPLLTSALKEAITKIETLETKVTALENA